MSALPAYEDFLRAKIPVKDDDAAVRSVFILPDPHARPHQDLATKWLVEGERRALFASFGLGKTRVQLRAVASIIATHGGRGLIVLPLGVRQEFTRDAAAIGIDIRFIRRIEEAGDTGLYMTNYETVRDGKLDPTHFIACSLDEASCFPSGTLVDTPNGKKKIETLQVGDSIINASGVDCVRDVFRTKIKRAVRLTIGDRTIIASDNHPFFTADGWRRADRLRPGEGVMETDAAVRMVCESDYASDTSGGEEAFLRSILLGEMASEQTGRKGTYFAGKAPTGCLQNSHRPECKMASAEDMRMVRGDLRLEIRQPAIKAVLRQSVFGEMANVATCEKSGYRAEVAYAGNKREARGVASEVLGNGHAVCRGVEKTINANLAGPRTYARVCCEDVGDASASWDKAKVGRRKGPRSYASSAGTSGALGGAMEGGIAGSCGAKEIGYSDVLLSRFGRPSSEDSDRSRWVVAQNENREGARHEERSVLGFSRVDRVEILECGHPDLDKFRDADGQLYFYDITATQHPSFSVEGLLVHNCLRGFGGTKTFREFMRLFEAVRFKFVATATPSPNEYIELLSYAAFLGVMDVGQAKTRFFKRDSTNADKLTLHPHKAEEFWFWVSSWALFIQRPSDLGYSDEGYALPELRVHYHAVPSEMIGKEADRGGQLMLIRDPAMGLQGAAKEKRDTLAARVEKIGEIINDLRREASILQSMVCSEQGKNIGETAGTQCHELSREQEIVCGKSEGLARKESRENEATSRPSQDGKQGVASRVSEGSLFGEHAEGEETNTNGEVTEVWARSSEVRRPSGGSEVRMCDLRTAGGIEPKRSSPLRRPLSSDRENSRSSMPEVQCWVGDVSGRSKHSYESEGLPDQLVIWCDLNAEQKAVEKHLKKIGVSFVSLDGSQDIDDREEMISRWRRKEATAFVSKPIMYGAGINLQQCHTMIYAGIGFKFADFIQGIHRVYRFLQTHEVNLHIIHAESEQAILRTLLRKWEQHKVMVQKMSDIIKEYGLSHAAMAKALERSIGCKRIEVSGDKYRLVNADCVEETARMESDSVGLIVTSIPFSTQYEYSPSYNDFGHTDDDAHFWRQMDYLVPQLFRVLKPGRDAAIHVKDRIIPGGVSGLGFQTLSTFSYDCIAAFKRHGFAYLGEKTITTDVVRENGQTYRLGWTEQCKDGSRMGFGVPEKLLLFRKPPSSRDNGYADEMVVKAKKWRVDADEENGVEGRWLNPEGYSRARWQLDAHAYTRSSGDRLITADEIVGFEASDVFKIWKKFSLETVYNFEHHVTIGEAFEERAKLPKDFMLLPPHSRHPDVWTDITRMLSANTLQSARGAELHLCPLQFDIVDRAINQWSNPGDVIFDPFGGLMTVPMRAVKFGRIGWGVELNHRYFLDGVAYVEAEARKIDVPTLFDALIAEASAKVADSIGVAAE